MEENGDTHPRLVRTVVHANSSSPCERCVKDGALCEYRPVDLSSASNNHISNYQDNPVNLYHVPPEQESVLPVNQGMYVLNQILSSKYNMNSSNSNLPSPVKERRRTSMACTPNCRSRKLKCHPLDLVDSTSCERCVKDGALCEYRPVDPSSVSNNHTSNYQDKPVNVYHVHSAPPLKKNPLCPMNSSNLARQRAQTHTLGLHKLSFTQTESHVVGSIQLIVPHVSDASKMELCVNIVPTVPSTQVQLRTTMLLNIKMTPSTFTIPLLRQTKNQLCKLLLRVIRTYPNRYVETFLLMVLRTPAGPVSGQWQRTTTVHCGHLYAQSNPFSERERGFITTKSVFH